MRHKALIAAFIFGSLLPTGAFAGARAASSPDVIADTMRAMFAALAVDDVKKLREILTDDFYAFDGGHRLNAGKLFSYVKSKHAAGTTFVWSVIDTHTHIAGDLASITYTNRGSISDPSGSVPMTWLEAAILRFENGRWRVEFIDSTRTPLAAGVPIPPSGDASPKSTYK
jgi:ketosteroid isomerase-like protein